jgi:hypothetical protein
MPVRLLTWVVFSLALLAGCAASPYQQEVNGTCGEVFTPVVCSGGGGGGGAMICGAVLLVELPFFSVCEGVYFLQHELAPVPAKSIHDGIYTAPTGAFSVRVPQDRPPVTYMAQQGALHGVSYVGFTPSAASAPTYTVAVVSGAADSTHYQAPEEMMPGKLGGSVLGVSYSSFGEVQRIRDPLPTTLDGQPALLGVYIDFSGNTRASAHFLVYILKQSHATISVSWTGPCPHCAQGSETEIMADAPGASDFVHSFHLKSAAQAATP